ncbi:hypothetical protein [Xanthomonas vesicatoria]|uniref:Uncharacterized protein n=2 Tax=Xanthomonas vesicatoria TaxID=56460 RepID=A0ABS8LCC7_9XANT|nr:hypothetical protein [Xanthomonas vesicatoria]MCC8559862.1 hypothetical protein [Xanthomonas vesicatoria]MCC8597248.1 hypothetical protein [Xanthomonas vesicatoria]MCC8600088.1 hypothetical protein [Xanthomonas vesicatoria]MCC8606570.1 hypothetical protein [Xanthomonas vesicatoria]MCC8609772.1 hypothetical protein [Xanthomonas vesicatoria]
MDNKYEFILSFGVPGMRAVCTEDPAWERIVAGIESVFVDGGRATLIMHYYHGVDDSNEKITAVVMEGVKGMYRILLRVDSNDPKREILKWWGGEGCNGVDFVSYLDQKWDPRGWLSDLDLAKDLMKVFF